MNKKNFSEQESVYNEIIDFYDFTEELVDTIEDDIAKDPITQLEIIEPLAEQIENSTDILSEEYRLYVSTEKTPNFLTRRKIAKAMKSIYFVLGECLNKEATISSMIFLSEQMKAKANQKIQQMNHIVHIFLRYGLLGPNTYKDVDNYYKNILNSKINAAPGGQTRGTK